jgi:hypothetical protein
MASTLSVGVTRRREALCEGLDFSKAADGAGLLMAETDCTV